MCAAMVAVVVVLWCRVDCFQFVGGSLLVAGAVTAGVVMCGSSLSVTGAVFACCGGCCCCDFWCCDGWFQFVGVRLLVDGAVTAGVVMCGSSLLVTGVVCCVLRWLLLL